MPSSPPQLPSSNSKSSYPTKSSPSPSTTTSPPSTKPPKTYPPDPRTNSPLPNPYLAYAVTLLSIAAVILAWRFSLNMATKPSNSNVNVFQKPLALFSQKPMTGFFRDGYCRTGSEDGGSHVIAAVVTDEFLDFSASRGNDLRGIQGMKSGCKWCLCTNRWKEAMEAAKGTDDPVVPKVFLHATDKSALDSVSMADLKKFAAEGETQGGGGALDKAVTMTPGLSKGVKEV